jgi:hypothetical protein
MIDLYLSFSINSIQHLPQFTSTYQDPFTFLLLFSPEVVLAFNEYFYTYYQGISSTYPQVCALFDSYQNNLDYNTSDNITYFFLFFLFS